jgi:gluconate kinase
MIVFINGCFGVGKTTIATLLSQRIENSLLYDPEEVGFMLRNILSSTDKKDDFQDYAAWRRLVPVVAKSMHDEYGKTLIIPMCIWSKDYFREVVDGLQVFEPNFHHFCLTASEDVIIKRLKSHEGHQWALSKVNEIVLALNDDLFGSQIDTTNISPNEVVELILKSIS